MCFPLSTIRQFCFQFVENTIFLSKKSDNFVFSSFKTCGKIMKRINLQIQAPLSDLCEVMVRENRLNPDEFELGLPFLRGRCLTVDLQRKTISFAPVLA